MDIIALGGNHPGNQTWLSNVKNAFSDTFPTHFITYDHWLNPKLTLDINKEAQKLHQLALNIKKPYVILAKSAGIAITLTAYQQQIVSPKAMIFVGFPLKWFKSHHIPIKQLLAFCNLPTLFIQNRYDPLGSADQLQTFLSKLIPNYRLVVLPGSNHLYANIQTLKEPIISFLKS